MFVIFLLHDSDRVGDLALEDILKESFFSGETMKKPTIFVPLQKIKEVVMLSEKEKEYMKKIGAWVCWNCRTVHSADKTKCWACKKERA